MRQQLDRTLHDSARAYSQTQSGVATLAPNRPTELTERSPAPLIRTGVPQSVIYPASPLVGTATLEATQIPLSQQIEAFARRVWAQGIRQVVIVPLFLLAGVHVKEDLPREIAAAQHRLPARQRLLCTAHLGSQPSFKQFVAARLGTTTADRCLLLAHGSRRAAGNRSVQQLGAVLDAEVAFWSVQPDLETQVLNLMQQGHRHIAIAPYFLFPGGITDAITHRTEALAERFARLSLRLLPPLGTSADLGKTVAEIALSLPYAVPMQTWERDRWRLTGNGITA